jgi:hypothetical protein
MGNYLSNNHNHEHAHYHDHNTESLRSAQADERIRALAAHLRLAQSRVHPLSAFAARTEPSHTKLAILGLLMGLTGLITLFALRRFI